jgi:DNA gyrase subunit A
MYKIKASAFPKGRVKDKGVLMHSLCKIGNEEVILYIPFEELFESQLVFVTRNGYVKRVSGIEFESSRNQINTSKLEDDDSIVYIKALSTEDVLADNKKVVFLTNKNYTLSYPVSQINEYKKTSRGVTGIKLEKGDYLRLAFLVGPDDKSVSVDSKEINVSRFKEGKRADKGKKIRI